jgi:hypothetical protein
MQDEQKAWIEETLTSLEGLQRVPAPAGLYVHIMTRISAVKPKRVALRGPIMWLAAAGFLLLVGLNGYALLHHGADKELSHSDARPDGPQRGGNPLVEEYFAPTSIL